MMWIKVAFVLCSLVSIANGMLIILLGSRILLKPGKI